MSTDGFPDEKRTPAPAGKMSRIFEQDEAARIGMTAWDVEELDAPAPARFSMNVKPHAASVTEDQEVLLKAQQARQQHELEEAIQRTRKEVEAKAQAQIQQEVEPWLRRMAQSIEDISTVRHRYMLESEEQLVRLAVAIARRIMHREIQVDGEALLGLIHAAIQRAELRELNRIMLNPKDHIALAPHLDRLNLPPRVQIVAEPSLERGALLLESTSGILDASIQSQLDEVERGFVDLLGRRG